MQAYRNFKFKTRKAERDKFRTQSWELQFPQSELQSFRAVYYQLIDFRKRAN